jgi:hypothetical protein
MLLTAGDPKAGDQKAGGAPSNSAAPAAEDSAVPAGLPAAATKIGSYRWRYTDAQGKVWIYRDTPFGLTKVLDQKPPEEVAPPSWKAVRVGDEIQFERPTPFGGMRWTKKEDQLDSLERKVWERDRPKNQPAAQPAGASSPAKE